MTILLLVVFVLKVHFSNNKTPTLDALKNPMGYFFPFQVATATAISEDFPPKPWLVVGFNPSEKYEFVNGDDDYSQY